MNEPCRGMLKSVRILPLRLDLTVNGKFATISMLRGVWGRALKLIDEGAYDLVFAESGGGPFYVCRPAEEQPARGVALEWFLFGPAVTCIDVLRRAWDVAGGMGYGKSREPFAVRRVVALDPEGLELRTPKPWRLDRVTWPLAGKPESTPCRLTFSFPVRMMRRGRLIEHPTLADIAVTAFRRLQVLGGGEAADGITTRDIAEIARSTPEIPWEGERLDFRRYSGSQNVEVEQRGVAGSLVLPDGPGKLWPLLAAAQWTHIGKGCVMGLGRLEIGGL